MVASATERRLPAMAPARTNDDQRPERQVAEVPGARPRAPARTRRRPATNATKCQYVRKEHRGLAPVPVDERPDEHPRHREEQHVSAADDSGRHDRLGLEVDPECQREPQEVVRDAREEGVGDEQMECLHGFVILPDRLKEGCTRTRWRVPITIADLPEAAASASLRLRDELLAILGVDLVSAWLHGGTTFADRSVRPGDLDICAVIANVAPDERTPRTWRADPGSRRAASTPLRSRSLANPASSSTRCTCSRTRSVAAGSRRARSRRTVERQAGRSIAPIGWRVSTSSSMGVHPRSSSLPRRPRSSAAPWTASSSISSGTSTRATPPIPTRRPTRS